MPVNYNFLVKRSHKLIEQSRILSRLFERQGLGDFNLGYFHYKNDQLYHSKPVVANYFYCYNLPWFYIFDHEVILSALVV